MSSIVNKLETAFVVQYPHFDLAKDNSAIEFSDEGSNYRVYLPTGKVHSDGSMDLKVKLDHILGGQPDDHAEINVSIDANGVYKSSPTVSYDMSSGTQIPDWVFYTADGIMGVTGLVVGGVVGVLTGILATPTGPGAVVAGLVTGTVSGVAVEGVAWGITGTMDLLNYLSLKTTEMSDDGGGIYFSEVVAHTLNRLSTAVIAANNGAFDQNIKFDHSDYLDGMDQSSWDDKNGAAVKYKYSGDHFRTWKQDISINYQNLGMLVSTKIDGIRDNNTDDHVILGALYNAYGQLVSAQAVVRMENEAVVSSGSVMYDDENKLIHVSESEIVDISNSYSTISEALEDILKNGMKAASHYSGYSDQRKHLPHVTKENLNAMNDAIRATN